MAKPSAAQPAEAQAPKVIKLRRIEDVVLIARIEGKTPLIPHRWSEKAIRMMADKQQQETAASAAPKREPKNPEQEAHDSCYWLDVKEDDGSVVTKGAMPATAFKAAMVGACRFYGGITMVQAKQLFYVEGEGADQLVAVDGDPVMRQDTPRNATGVADLRYRMMFFPWSATLRVRFIPTMIDPDSVLALLDAGGKGGVGDWRPSSPKSHTGTFGQFQVIEG
jgi:hypothetical protein